jgi:hypothetical protein
MAVDYDKLARESGAVDLDSLAKSLGAVEPSDSTSAPIPVAGHTRRPPGFLKRLAQETVKQLPAIGGTIGAAIGSPALAAGQVEVPVGGAMLGGLAGKALQQQLSGPVGLEPGPTDLAQALIQQGNAAATQGALEGVPQGVVQGVKSVGGALAKSQMAKALAPAKGLLRNFPKVVEDALSQKATVGKIFGKGGSDVSEQIRKDATGKVMGLLRASTQKGKSIDIESVAEPVISAVEKKAGRLAPQERADLIQAVQDRADALLLKSVVGATQRSSKLASPMMADELRKAAANSAKASLRAEGLGIPQTALPQMDRLIAKGAANAVKRLSGVRAARVAEQRAIGVARAVKEAELSPNRAAIGVGLGPVKVGIGVPPSVASRVALGAQGAAEGVQDPITSFLIGNFLRSLSNMAPSVPYSQ